MSNRDRMIAEFGLKKRLRRTPYGALIFHREGKQVSGLIQLCIESGRHLPGGRRRAADIGASLGESTEILSAYFDSIYSVDTWSHDDLDVVRRVAGLDVEDWEVEDSFDRRMKELSPIVCKVKYGSPEAAGRFPDGFFDLVYIDANHRYEKVVEDIRAWRPKTRLIGGHDFCDTGDVCRAVVDELRQPQWIFEDSSWMVDLR